MSLREVLQLIDSRENKAEEKEISLSDRQQEILQRDEQWTKSLTLYYIRRRF